MPSFSSAGSLPLLRKAQSPACGAARLAAQMRDCGRWVHFCLAAPAGGSDRRRHLLRDNLDEKGGGDQSFEAAADSGVMIVADLKLCKGFFGAAV